MEFICETEVCKPDTGKWVNTFAEGNYLSAMH